jgi:hypothetical protein
VKAILKLTVKDAYLSHFPGSAAQFRARQYIKMTFFSMGGKKHNAVKQL